MEPKPREFSERESEMRQMGAAVTEAFTRMMEAEGRHADPIQMMTVGMESDADIVTLRNYLEQHEPELNEEEKFYLKAKIHLLELKNS